MSETCVSFREERRRHQLPDVRADLQEEMAEQRFPFRRIRRRTAATERTSRRRVIKHCAPRRRPNAATKGGLLQPICKRRPGEDPSAHRSRSRQFSHV